jgi:carbamate kinase
VVDKDLTTSVLAEALDADVLLILTDVPNVIRGYGTPDAEPVLRATPGVAAARGLRRRVDGAEGRRRLPLRRGHRRHGGHRPAGGRRGDPRGTAGTIITPREVRRPGRPLAAPRRRHPAARRTDVR